eukprot:TRINITY_DN2764_c0_g1_i1.p1 TRINITY_DN2764_c0_g1~~TRINITY_DN2764_c0_g1_i1.p1  ORF type:complete len:1682 (+),score=281.00 TRINITY_DN2764_c0_g1_i1:746-5047(+)
MKRGLYQLNGPSKFLEENQLPASRLQDFISFFIDDELRSLNFLQTSAIGVVFSMIHQHLLSPIQRGADPKEILESTKQEVLNRMDGLIHTILPVNSEVPIHVINTIMTAAVGAQVALDKIQYNWDAFPDEEIQKLNKCLTSINNFITQFLYNQNTIYQSVRSIPDTLAESAESDLPSNPEGEETANPDPKNSNLTTSDPANSDSVNSVISDSVNSTISSSVISDSVNSAISSSVNSDSVISDPAHHVSSEVAHSEPVLNGAVYRLRDLLHSNIAALQLQLSWLKGEMEYAASQNNTHAMIIALYLVKEIRYVFQSHKTIEKLFVSKVSIGILLSHINWSPLDAIDEDIVARITHTREYILQHFQIWESELVSMLEKTSDLESVTWVKKVTFIHLLVSCSSLVSALQRYFDRLSPENLNAWIELAVARHAKRAEAEKKIDEILELIQKHHNLLENDNPWTEGLVLTVFIYRESKQLLEGIATDVYQFDLPESLVNPKNTGSAPTQEQQKLKMLCLHTNENLSEFVRISSTKKIQQIMSDDSEQDVMRVMENLQTLYHMTEHLVNIFVKRSHLALASPQVSLPITDCVITDFTRTSQQPLLSPRSSSASLQSLPRGEPPSSPRGTSYKYESTDSYKSRDMSPRGTSYSAADLLKTRDVSPRGTSHKYPSSELLKSCETSPRKSRDASPCGALHKSSSADLRKARDISPLRSRDASPCGSLRKSSSTNLRRPRDMSPRRSRDASPRRSRDVSPRRLRDASPRKSRDVSPCKSRDVSPRKSRDVSPRRSQNASPRRSRDVSPRKSRDVSPRKSRGVSPRDVSPHKSRDVSPRKSRDVSRSHKSRDGSPLSPRNASHKSPSRKSSDASPLSPRESSHRRSEPLSHKPHRSSSRNFMKSRDGSPLSPRKAHKSPSADPHKSRDGSPLSPRGSSHKRSEPLSHRASIPALSLGNTHKISISESSKASKETSPVSPRKKDPSPRRSSRHKSSSRDTLVESSHTKSSYEASTISSHESGVFRPPRRTENIDTLNEAPEPSDSATISPRDSSVTRSSYRNSVKEASHRVSHRPSNEGPLISPRESGTSKSKRRNSLKEDLPSDEALTSRRSPRRSEHRKSLKEALHKPSSEASSISPRGSGVLKSRRSENFSLKEVSPQHSAEVSQRESGVLMSPRRFHSVKEASPRHSDEASMVSRHESGVLKSPRRSEKRDSFRETSHKPSSDEVSPVSRQESGLRSLRRSDNKDLLKETSHKAPSYKASDEATPISPREPRSPRRFWNKDSEATLTPKSSGETPALSPRRETSALRNQSTTIVNLVIKELEVMLVDVKTCPGSKLVQYALTLKTINTILSSPNNIELRSRLVENANDPLPAVTPTPSQLPALQEACSSSMKKAKEQLILFVKALSGEGELSAKKLRDLIALVQDVWNLIQIVQNSQYANP